MENGLSLVAFEKHKIRRFYDEQNDTWYFSIIDVVGALTDSVNPRDYWFKMKIRVKTEDEFELSTICRQLKMKAADGKMRKNRLKKEGSQTVTNCNRLKMMAADGET